MAYEATAPVIAFRPFTIHVSEAALIQLEKATHNRFVPVGTCHVKQSQNKRESSTST
jgi:hypothetical protein